MLPFFRAHCRLRLKLARIYHASSHDAAYRIEVFEVQRGSRRPLPRAISSFRQLVSAVTASQKYDDLKDIFIASQNFDNLRRRGLAHFRLFGKKL